MPRIWPFLHKLLSCAVVAWAFLFSPAVAAPDGWRPLLVALELGLPVAPVPCTAKVLLEHAGWEEVATELRSTPLAELLNMQRELDGLLGRSNLPHLKPLLRHIENTLRTAIAAASGPAAPTRPSGLDRPSLPAAPPEGTQIPRLAPPPQFSFPHLSTPLSGTPSTPNPARLLSIHPDGRPFENTFLGRYATLEHPGSNEAYAAAIARAQPSSSLPVTVVTFTLTGLKDLNTVFNSLLVGADAIRNRMAALLLEKLRAHSVAIEDRTSILRDGKGMRIFFDRLVDDRERRSIADAYLDAGRLLLLEINADRELREHFASQPNGFSDPRNFMALGIGQASTGQAAEHIAAVYTRIAAQFPIELGRVGTHTSAEQHALQLRRDLHRLAGTLQPGLQAISTRVPELCNLVNSVWTPSSEFIEVIRKSPRYQSEDTQAQWILELLGLRYGTDRVSSITPQQIKDLVTFVTLTNAFSPLINMPSADSHPPITSTTHDAITGDIRGLGARDLAAMVASMMRHAITHDFYTMNTSDVVALLTAASEALTVEANAWLDRVRAHSSLLFWRLGDDFRTIRSLPPTEFARLAAFLAQQPLFPPRLSANDPEATAALPAGATTNLGNWLALGQTAEKAIRTSFERGGFYAVVRDIDIHLNVTHLGRGTDGTDAARAAFRLTFVRRASAQPLAMDTFKAQLNTALTALNEAYAPRGLTILRSHMELIQLNGRGDYTVTPFALPRVGPRSSRPPSRQPVVDERDFSGEPPMFDSRLSDSLGLRPRPSGSGGSSSSRP